MYVTSFELCINDRGGIILFSLKIILMKAYACPTFDLSGAIKRRGDFAPKAGEIEMAIGNFLKDVKKRLKKIK
jgi:hypothetical protein